MKKTFCFTTILVILFCQTAFADLGDFGFFGGISEGRKLPKTTQILLSKVNTANKKTQTSYVYKEMVFLNGRPMEFEGLLTIKPSGGVSETENVGTYTENYKVSSSDTTNKDIVIDRNIVFNVNYRKEGKQVIKDYEVKTWFEEIILGGEVYTLDPKQSYYGVSILSDFTPGVEYYKGDISSKAVYTRGGSENPNTTILENSGSIYGYKSAWSSTETHRIDATVFNNDWQMQYQIRPSVSVNKLLQYSDNEPTAISFSGNYKEVMQNESGATYDIFILPKMFYDVETTGKMVIPTANNFEQLVATNAEFLKGHPAEDDIKKLFAMQILDGDPKFYKPDQAITRAQFVTALAKAIKLPVELVETTAKSKKTEVIKLTFPDVFPENPNYPFIMASYKAGIAIGRDNGYFYSDSSIERQEALTVLIRTLGLSELGIDPTPITSFTDDYKIAAWAKKELYAAERIGLISGDKDGNINPKNFVTKAEAAALINRLVDYMRNDLKQDYTEHIVNYSK